MNEIKNQPEALRLAHLLELDKWPGAATELRRLHAENQDLRTRHYCNTAEIESLQARVQELGEMARENRSKRIVELEGRIAEMEEQMAAIGAGGVEPLRKRAEAAPQAVQAAVPEAIEQMAADRYKVVPSHESVFHRWAVVAGEGTQQLYIGREGECQNMARKFMGAFLDGAFVAMQNAAPAHPAEGVPASVAVQEENQVDQLFDAVLNCPHSITAESVTLRFTPKQEGHNALSQLQHRLAVADMAARQRELQLLGEIEALERLALGYLKRQGSEVAPQAVQQ